MYMYMYLMHDIIVSAYLYDNRLDGGLNSYMKKVLLDVHVVVNTCHFDV